MSMSFWGLRGMGFGLHDIGSPVDEISNKLVFPTSVEHLDMML